MITSVMNVAGVHADTDFVLEVDFVDYCRKFFKPAADFAAFARSFGADGEAVNTPEELDTALGRAFVCEGPYIIDCKIDKDEFVLPMLPPGGSMDDIITKLEVPQ